MKKIILMLLINASLYGQKHDNIWPMGYIGDTAASACNFYLDFEHNTLDLVPYCLGIQYSFACGHGAIADSFGDLLFYTNGYIIADSSHQIMSNGIGLNNSNYSSYEDWGYPAELIILPRPNRTNLYDIFHLERQLQSNGAANGLAIQLNHSIVDMSLNNGLGDISSKNISILSDTIGGWGQLIESCKHSNGQDWWILVPEYESNAYYRFLLTADSLFGPFRQEEGYSFSWIDYSGQAIFSPDGSLYVRYDPQNQAHLYDFNRCTGELSYRQQINVPSNSNAGGAAISSNSRFLYIANDTIVFQYDLQAVDINASRVTVAIYDGYMSPFPTAFWQMQLAPDGKIYEVSLSSTDRLHVIDNPDSAGLACNFRQHAIITPPYNGTSIPNFPHFRTPALPAGACDTTGVALLPVVKAEIKIYPNPSYNGNFTIAVQEKVPDYIQVHDLLGRLLLQVEWNNAGSEKEVQLPSGTKGVYFVSVWKKGKLLGREKVHVLE
jgi:hypothetical protein